MAAFPLRSIVVVGGGISGWVAAATLARVLGFSCQVRVVELPDDNAINGAVASVPSLHRLLRLLGIDEVALLRAADGTFRLGTLFRDWAVVGQSYFSGFGSIGAKLDAVPFQHHWLRLLASGERAELEDFSMAAQAAKLQRFAVPDSDPRSVLSLFTYAWHFDAQSLRNYLRECARSSGVAALTGELADVILAPDDGFIQSLVLSDGARVEADFFIDCSGAGALPGAALDAQIEDWSAWLPCDRMQSVRSAPQDPLPPYSECTADTSGWRASLPLQHSVIRSYVYSSEHIRDDAVSAQLAADAGAIDAVSARPLMRGRPKQFWTRNCLRMPGDAFDPLESAGLHLAQTGITRFLAHFPVSRSSPTDAAEYNRLTAEEYDRLRDLTVLHYHATQRADSPFWDACRNMRVPDSLAHRLELFTDSGRLTIGEEEHCGADGWLAVLSGQGIVPASYDPLADATPLASVRGAFAAMATEMRQRATTLPLHREYLARRGATAARSATS